MKPKKFQSILENEILPFVQKPGRYIGGEINSVRKDHRSVDVKVVLAFPDIYDIGISHLGSKILYEIINRLDWAVAERVFAPWVDMEEKMREKAIPLYSLETLTPIRDFDILGFSLQYELCYTNLLNMLDLAGIPLRSKERLKSSSPLVIAGGPGAFVPEPIWEFIDLFVIGDAEELIVDILSEFKKWNNREKFRKNPSLKLDFLKNLTARYKGIYVPHFYKVTYDSDSRFKKIEPKFKNIPKIIEKQVLKDLNYDYYPTRPVVPLVKVVHDRAILEIMRGCTKGCRFCQAGILYRPLRERSVDYIISKVKESIANTGYEEISLSSLSTGDYSNIDEMVSRLVSEFEQEKTRISLSSLRVDSFSVRLAEKVRQIKKTGITFAPETASPRLKKLINKTVGNEELLSAALEAYSRGWRLIKLYFIIGLPTETYEDLDGLIHLIFRVAEQRKKIDGRTGNVNVSISCFVPKAHTPFQWEGFQAISEFYEKIRYVRSKIRSRNIKLKFHDPERSYIEAIFSRGDRKLSQVVYEAWREGCRLDDWSEHFDFEKWLAAFKKCGLDPDDYAYRRFEYSDALPWNHISPRVSKRFLIEEMEKASRLEETADCMQAGCVFCGTVCDEQEKENPMNQSDKS